MHSPDICRLLFPVFVYIHGGGFSAGYASEIEFNASHLAAQGVVVVLLQYRLSALGWLALPELSAEGEHGVSGNYAVLDLVQYALARYDLSGNKVITLEFNIQYQEDCTWEFTVSYRNEEDVNNIIEAYAVVSEEMWNELTEDFFYAVDNVQ